MGNYQYQTAYFTFTNAYGFNNAAVGGTGYNFANPDIRWERAATFNIGVDMDFFNAGLTISLDYYNKVTSDILVPPAVPGVFGTGLPDFNAGKVGNRGWELSAAYHHEGKRFTHQVSFNLGDSRNEVLDFQDEARLTGREELQILLREGYPYNSYVGLKRAGYFRNVEDVKNSAKPEGLTNLQPGDNKYVDINNDGVINDDDNVVFGNPFPRLTFGFIYNLACKGFDLNIFLQGVGKRTMMLRGELVEPGHYYFAERNSGEPDTYYLDRDKLRADGTTEVTDPEQVYRIRVDFSNGTSESATIETIELWFPPLGQFLFELPYTGNGTWTIENTPIEFKQESWGRDERYKFRFTVKQDGTESYEWFGSVNGDNARPDESTPDQFWYMVPVTDDYWANCFKFATPVDNNNADISIVFNTSVQEYTHIVAPQ